MADATAPVDKTHEQSLFARRWINEMAVELKLRAAKWELRPMPEGWRG